MVIIVCLDQKNGMMYQQRRLSNDKKIIDDIYNTLYDVPLYMNAYSSELFTNYPGNIVVDEDFMNHSEFFSFVEMSDFDDETVDEIIVYRFDQVYPADKFFPIDLDEYVLMDQDAFCGHSHDVIKKEIYSRIL